VLKKEEVIGVENAEVELREVEVGVTLSAFCRS
jgi:hypothetical protein